jgi:hypothetical protein
MTTSRALAIASVTVVLVAAVASDYGARRQTELALAVSQARVDALERDLGRALGHDADARDVAGTTGRPGIAPDVALLSAGIAERVKDDLRTEMGWLPARTLRARRESFVELYATDADARESYGTAGHLGGGYFITVKHGVLGLRHDQAPIEDVRLRIDGRLVRARVIDAGAASTEVHPGDWAILQAEAPVMLPALTVDLRYAFPFGDSIVRLGNDYSKGIIAASGYVGQEANGLVTCLTDGHPGASGGGVLDADGDLVGIPVGRLQGDFRFSFILPVRAEMFRKVPAIQAAAR